MAPKKRRKPLRGAVPGSSKFARISARAASGGCTAPLVSSGGAPSPLSPSQVESACSASLLEGSSSDLPLETASFPAPLLDLEPISAILSSNAVEGPSSGVDVSLGFGPPGSSPNVVVGSTSNVDAENGSPSVTVVGPTSGEVTTEPLSQELKDVNISPPRKYATVARDSSCLEEIGTPTQHISGAPFVFIPDENIQAAKVEFKDFVFAQFHGPSPAMGRIIGVVNALWAKQGPRIFVHNLGAGSFLFKITNPRAREAILSRNMWNIAGHPMFVAPWSPDFSPDSPPISSAIVTVELRGVPYLLFNKESLGRIATAVGKPIALAPETARKENFEVAKILVRINLLKDLPSRVVSGFSDGREIDIEVSYPWLPPKCAVCNQFGHETSLCRLKPPSASGRKVARRSTSRRGRPSRRERLSRKANHSREGRSRTVASTRLLSSAVSVMEGTSEENKATNFQIVVEPELGKKIELSELPGPVLSAPVILSPAEPSSILGTAKEVEQPFILVSHRKSGRKAASLH